MKVYFDFEMYKGICLSLANEIKKVKPDVLVCIPRKGMFPTQIIYEALELDVSYFFPKTETLYFPPHMDEKNIKTLVFIDDGVSPKARTYKLLKEFMKNKPFTWYFVPILVDHEADIELDEHFYMYGLKVRQDPWFVYPYEVSENIKEYNFTYFRDKEE